MNLVNGVLPALSQLGVQLSGPSKCPSVAELVSPNPSTGPVTGNGCLLALTLTKQRRIGGDHIQAEHQRLSQLPGSVGNNVTCVADSRFNAKNKVWLGRPIPWIWR
jgi:hypothetical protein